MADNDRSPTETETIMMALDQISQTIEVMTSVVGRLRTYVQERDTEAAASDSEARTNKSRITSRNKSRSKSHNNGGETNSEAAVEIQSDRILH